MSPIETLKIRLSGGNAAIRSNAAMVLSTSLQTAGAKVDWHGALPNQPAPLGLLRGVTASLDIEKEAQSSFFLEKKLPRLLVAAFLTLMIAGAEIRLHFTPRLGVGVLLVILFWYWRKTGPKD